MILAATAVTTVKPQYGPYIIALITLGLGVVGWYIRRLVNALDRSNAERTEQTAKAINENAAAIIGVANKQVDLQREMSRAHYELAERVARIEAAKT
jgi:hypothetical protein